MCFLHSPFSSASLDQISCRCEWWSLASSKCASRRAGWGIGRGLRFPFAFLRMAMLCDVPGTLFFLCFLVLYSPNLTVKNQNRQHTELTWRARILSRGVDVTRASRKLWGFEPKVQFEKYFVLQWFCRLFLKT